MPKQPEIFWMVSGNGPAVVRHSEREVAFREARRLAAENPGVEFFVVQAIACIRKVDVETIDMRPETVWKRPF